jgi:hypothetical protein
MRCSYGYRFVAGAHSARRSTRLAGEVAAQVLRFAARRQYRHAYAIRTKGVSVFIKGIAFAARTTADFVGVLTD